MRETKTTKRARGTGSDNAGNGRDTAGRAGPEEDEGRAGGTQKQTANTDRAEANATKNAATKGGARERNKGEGKVIFHKKTPFFDSMMKEFFL